MWGLQIGLWMVGAVWFSRAVGEGWAFENPQRLWSDKFIRKRI